MQDASFVSYLRVSTKDQGIDGYGVSAQRHTVDSFVRSRGTLLAEYSEVESGRNCHRPELDKAIAHCRKEKATLLVAKLDRLARNVLFLLQLRESKVDFIACDCPQANRMTLTILMAVAEAEAESISQRTKAGLAAAKARGVKLGGRNMKKLQRMAVAVNKQRAQEFADQMAPAIATARRKGWTTLEELADWLNGKGYKTPRGKSFFPASVRNLLALLA